jgi:hypothetical protein
MASFFNLLEIMDTVGTMGSMTESIMKSGLIGGMVVSLLMGMSI